MTYNTVDDGAKRKFQIEIIETEPNIQCKALINSNNELRIFIDGNKYKEELYGIVYNHEEVIEDLKSVKAVECFIDKLRKILPPVGYPLKEHPPSGKNI